MTSNQPMRRGNRRGTALAAFIGALVVVQIKVIAVTLRATHDAELIARSSEGMQALYAAEGALQLAYREMALGVDEDGDGAIGGVSDDGDPANDPLIGPGAAWATVIDAQLLARARSGVARRQIGVDLAAGGGGGNGNGGNTGNGTGSGGGNSGNGSGNGGGNGTANEGGGAGSGPG